MPQPLAAPGGPRYRILLVDDEAVMLRSMESALSHEMDVVTCTSGAQALRMLEIRPFDVVCSDYLMPGMSGVDVLRAAAQLQEEASCLLVTAVADEVPTGDRRRYFVLIKPFEADRFARLVGQLARVAQMKRQVKSSAPRPADRDSRPPPSSRHGEPMSERRPSSVSPPPASTSSLPPLPPPSSFGSPRGSSGGSRK